MQALEKFMDSFGITYDLDIRRIYVENGRPACCVLVTVSRNEQTEYRIYHCYSLKPNGKLKYEETNETKGIHQGILAYLGMDRQIDHYFETKARDMANKYLVDNS